MILTVLLLVAATMCALSAALNLHDARGAWEVPRRRHVRRALVLLAAMTWCLMLAVSRVTGFEGVL